MKNIGNLEKVIGSNLMDVWFIPTMFKSMELDNTFVLWSSPESEYYIDTTNNLLKIKYFRKIKKGSLINIDIRDGEIYAYKTYGKKDNSFKELKISNYLYVNGDAYEITNVTFISDMAIIELDENDKSNFISSYVDECFLIDKEAYDSGKSYFEKDNMYFKKYVSNNVADAYIDGEDIISIVGSYY